MNSQIILVVDDSMIMRRIIANHLRSLGWNNILEASDGYSALSLLRKKRIDLIISDWCMRGMHGIDLLRAVRADPALEKLPFIMITAEGQPHNIDEAWREKVDCYILKPFTKAALARNVQDIFHLSVRENSHS